MNSLNVFGHFVELALKGLKKMQMKKFEDHANHAKFLKLKILAN